LVAAAGPGANLILTIVAALAFHLADYLPANAAQWVVENLKNALIINVVLAIFNLLPLPPLDGRRIAVSALPRMLTIPVSRLEPYGSRSLFAAVSLIGSAADDFGTSALAQVQRSGEPSQVSEPNLTGDWGGCGYLERHGITFTLNYTNDFLANVLAAAPFSSRKRGMSQTRAGMPKDSRRLQKKSVPGTTPARAFW
jgi:hypothetical protein